MRILSIALISLLAACGDTPNTFQTPCSDAGAGPIQDSSIPPKDPSSPDAMLSEPCALRVDSIDPPMIRLSEGGSVLVRVRGCAFVGVQDVQVNVTSVSFIVLDDTTLVFRSSDVGMPPVPYRAEVDIIKRQPDQTQTFLTYQ